MPSQSPCPHSRRHFRPPRPAGCLQTQLLQWQFPAPTCVVVVDSSSKMKKKAKRTTLPPPPPQRGKSARAIKVALSTNRFYLNSCLNCSNDDVARKGRQAYLPQDYFGLQPTFGFRSALENGGSTPNLNPDGRWLLSFVTSTAPTVTVLVTSTKSTTTVACTNPSLFTKC